MPRPALVVGLGGTGQWVLTWLKRDLQLWNNGEVPKNVRLLSIDTATMLEAGATRIGQSGVQEEAAEVGGVTLDKGEFIYVGGDSRPLAEFVRDGKLKQIGQWYQASRWLESQMPAAFILDDGAGRLRQFGRMAIYKDVLGRKTSSLIWRSLHSAMDEVRALTSQDRRLEIIVVGSFAGGTGSGMFIDVALILRMLADQLGIHHVLRGFFALPSVFTAAPGTEIKARTFAAWRELNRFMVINDEFPMAMIEYVEEDPEFRIRPKMRLFDACYLVDGKRKGVAIAEEAKSGVFPMMSEVISAFLDEKAGTAYTQWVFTNLASEYARRPDLPMYSTVGAYTVQVPAYFVQELSSHDYAKDILHRILSPAKPPDKKTGRLVTEGAERTLANAAPNKNLEDQGFAGRSRSLKLLREAVERDGKVARPTRFHGRIAELYDLALDQNQRGRVVDQLARAGGADPKSGAAAASWVTYYPDLGDDPRFASVRTAVHEMMTYDIKRQYGGREGEKEEERRARMKGIPEDVRTRYGGITSSGEEVEEYYGTCGDALMNCQNTHMVVFRNIIKTRLVDLLMGRSENAVTARTGKLGYAFDYFDGLVDVFDKFLSLMDDVKKKRDDIKPELKLSGLSTRAAQYVNSTMNKKIFWFFEHPDVKGAEDAYLQAQQRLVEVRREDILHTFVVTTVRQMRELCKNTRDSLEHWIWHLSTGNDANSVSGLWDDILAHRKQLEVAHSYDTDTQNVQRVVADQTIEHSEEDIEKALGQWHWLVNVDEAGNVTIKSEIRGDDPARPAETMEDPSFAKTSELRMDIGKKNQRSLLNLAGKRYRGVAMRTTVGEEIKDQYPDPATFSTQVADVSAEPLFDGEPGNNPRTKSNLIRVKVDDNDPYFTGADGLEGELRNTNHLDRNKRTDFYSIQVVGSENPYKLTLVRTDDLYKFSDFSAWKSCMDAYATHMGTENDPLDPVLMHNFAAEQRAVEFERQLFRGGSDYRPLHPRVVVLLEDPVAIRQFVYLGMMGKITQQEGQSYHWELTWEKSTGEQTLWLTKGWNPDTDKTRKKEPPDIFQAIHGYVIMGVNQAPGRRDVIDKEFAQVLIDREMKDLGRAGEEKLIRDNLADGGFVGWLRSLAYNPDVPGRIEHHDYADLAEIVTLMLNERLAQLKRSGPRGGFDEKKPTKSPFKTAGTPAKPTRAKG